MLNPSDYTDGDMSPVIYVKEPINFRNKILEIGEIFMKASFVAIFTGLKMAEGVSNGTEEDVTHIHCVPIIFYGENAEFMTNFFKGSSIWVACTDNMPASKQWLASDFN